MFPGAVEQVLVPSEPSGDWIEPPTAREILKRPLPKVSLLDRTLLRSVALIARSKLTTISGLDHIQPSRDPFIIALNHSSRQEALLLPALLIMCRSGQRIHFLADWNFRMIPGVDLIYRRAGVITVMRKSARPRFLNIFKPLFRDVLSPIEQARRHLLAGRSIGIFPEGTVNRDPLRLMRGRMGAARLALETGVPVVPAGLRFPTVPKGAAVPDGSPIEIEIGPPLQPPATRGQLVSLADVRAWHAEVMTAIAVLSGKSWQHEGREAAHEANEVHAGTAR